MAEHPSLTRPEKKKEEPKEIKEIIDKIEEITPQMVEFNEKMPILKEDLAQFKEAVVGVNKELDELDMLMKQVLEKYLEKLKAR